MSDGAHRSENDRQPAETARRLVLEQHVQLRRMLSMGLVQARQSAVADGGQEPLRGLVGLIRDVFVQHLADEEALIVPILEDDLPVGPFGSKRSARSTIGNGASSRPCAPGRRREAIWSSPPGSRPWPRHCSGTSPTRSASS